MFTCLVPVPPGRHVSGATAPPVAQLVASLDGITIALVDNGKPRADELLRAIASELQIHARGLEVIGPIRTDHLMEASEAQLDDVAARADFVINGLGDCGACSAFTAVVASAFEERGIPSIAIFTKPFEFTAKEIFARRGMPDKRFVALEHPVASVSPGELADRAHAAVLQILEILTARTGTDRTTLTTTS